MNGHLQVGYGPHKVLAMNGWLGDASQWLTTVNALDPALFTFVLFDYRGYGRSRHIDGAYTFAESAVDALVLADKLAWERFSLMGHSMGGAAMQRVLLAAPQRIDRMLAITAVPACSSRMDAARLASFESAVAEVSRRAAIIGYSTGNRLPAAWAAQMAQRSWEATAPAAFAAYLQEWATNDFSMLVQDNPTRLKLLVGEFDPTLTLEIMQRTWMSYYPRAEVETLPQSGHYPMFETPLALAAKIQEFLLS